MNGLAARDLRLEGDGDAAAEGAGSLDEIDCLAVLGYDWDVALSQQVSDIYHRVHVSRQEAESRNALADEKIQVGITLALSLIHI